MLIGLDFNPIPPQDILEKLRRVDPALGLKFVQGMKLWAITWKWPLMDPRRELIQQGKIAPEDYDVFTFLPEDCSADEAFGYIEKSFVRNSGRKEIAYMLNRLDEFNEKQVEKNLQETTEYAEELIEANVHTLFPGKEIPKTNRSRSGKKKDDLEEFIRESH